MKKTAKIISLILVLAIFALMAMGSGSSSDGSAQSGGSQDTGKTEEKPADTSGKAPEPEKKDAYEVGEGRALVYSDSIGSCWVQISVPVTNTGSTNLYLSSGTMDLEDADGHLVDSKAMVSVFPTVLKPGETAWYYEETTLDQTPSTELKVVPHVDVKGAKVDCIRFDISDLSIGNEQYGGIKITGRVENTSDKDESMVYIVVFMYDKDGELLGQAFTILTDDLKAGEKMGFSASTFSSNPAFIVENVDHYEVFAYPLQYQF